MTRTQCGIWAGRTHLGEVETGTVTSVIIISIHVKDFLPFNRQQAGENAFRQPCTQDDDLMATV